MFLTNPALSNPSVTRHPYTPYIGLCSIKLPFEKHYIKTNLIGKPLLVELAGLLLLQWWPVPRALRLRRAGVGPVTGLVLLQELEDD